MILRELNGSRVWQHIKREFRTGYKYRQPVGKIMGGDVHVTISYLHFALPLSLLSAYLILWKPRKPSPNTRTPNGIDYVCR